MRTRHETSRSYSFSRSATRARISCSAQSELSILWKAISSGTCSIGGSISWALFGLFINVLAALIVAADCGSGSSPDFGTEKEAVMRRLCSYAAILTSAWLAALTCVRAADPGFQQWLQELWPQAQALGVSRATFDAATRALEPDLT